MVFFPGNEISIASCTDFAKGRACLPELVNRQINCLGKFSLPPGFIDSFLEDTARECRNALKETKIFNSLLFPFPLKGFIPG